MEVTFTWCETTSYKSTINIPDDEFEEWWAEVQETAPQPLTDVWVKDYLDNGPEEAWFDRVDINRDYVGSSDRYIEEVQGFKGGPA